MKTTKLSKVVLNDQNLPARKAKNVKGGDIGSDIRARKALFAVIESIVAKFDESTTKTLQKIGQ